MTAPKKKTLEKRIEELEKRIDGMCKAINNTRLTPDLIDEYKRQVEKKYSPDPNICPHCKRPYITILPKWSL